MRIIYEGHEYDADEKLSLKDFTGWDFRDRPEYDFNGKVIYGSCFSQEIPDNPIFGKPLENTIFIACNLDNVLFLE